MKTKVTSKMFFLIDATGSMANILQKTKLCIELLFTRVQHLLEDNGQPKDCFEFKIGVYRNYNTDEAKIYEESSWEKSAENLQNFLQKITPCGGMGREAIEIAFSKCAEELSTNPFSQIVLMGDAPPNTKKEVETKRNHVGEGYWKNTKYSKPTYYEDEMAKIKQYNVPIHAIYLEDHVKDEFDYIAESTGGKSGLLKVMKDDCVEILTNLIGMEILNEICLAINNFSMLPDYEKRYNCKYSNSKSFSN